jgi:hypothetical protein
MATGMRCLHCGIAKPTPEEKCEKEPSIEEMSSEEFIGHLFYNVLGGIHANEEIDARRGILDMIADKSSPSPEARVDWAKEASNMFWECHCNEQDSGDDECMWCKIRKQVAKALSAAFEKGREAR